MAQTLSWVHFGDLRVDEADDAMRLIAPRMAPYAQVNDEPPVPMQRGADRIWSATLHAMPAGLRRITVNAADERHVIEVLVRGPGATPERIAPAALGRDVHAIGAWPEAGITGAQPGPNKNGADW